MPRSAVLAAAALALGFGLFAGARPAVAQVQLTLTVTPASISFPDANPDLAPTITSTPTPVQVRVRVRNNGGSAWSLTVLAADDLRAGASVIAIGNVGWTSSLGSPWQASGTLSRTAPQTVANGIGNLNPAQTSNLTFVLQNRWTYNPGNFTATVTFTLTAP